MIQPEPVASVSATRNYVLFHFSDFNVGKRCNDASVTVLDGNGINMKPIKGSSQHISAFLYSKANRSVGIK